MPQLKSLEHFHIKPGYSTHGEVDSEFVRLEHVEHQRQYIKIAGDLAGGQYSEECLGLRKCQLD